MKKVHFLLSFGFLLLIYSCEQEINREPISFIVAGNIGAQIENENSTIYSPFEKSMNSLDKKGKFDFAVFTGNCVAQCTENDWLKLTENLKQFQMPTYFAPSPIDYSKKDVYLKNCNPSNYSFVKSNSLFLCWNVNKDWNVSEKQISDLEVKIKNAKYDNIFIFSHVPYWYKESVTPQIRPDNLDKRKAPEFYNKIIHRLVFLKIPVFLIAGDVGATDKQSELTLHRFKNIRMIGSGMGFGNFDNFLSVSVKDKKTSVKINYLNGSKPLIIDSLYNQILI